MNQLSSIEMNKLMHYFFIGFEYKLNVEKKKLLLDIFKRKSFVKIKDMKNYVEVSTFEKPISHRKKDSEWMDLMVSRAESLVGTQNTLKNVFESGKETRL